MKSGGKTMHKESIKEFLFVVRAEDLPRPILVIGRDGEERIYQLMPTKKQKGAQFCAAGN
jgi:hypothetical protein